MDTMSMVSSILSAQAGNTQMQVQASIIKSNADAEKFAVQTLLGGQASLEGLMVAMSVITMLALLYFGVLFFRRMERSFADVI